MQQQDYADRVHDLTRALVARLRGVAPRGGAAIYADLKLEDFKLLSSFAPPGGAHRLAATSDYPVVFADAAKQRILDHYRDVELVHRRLTRRVPLANFYPTRLPRLGAWPTPKQAGEGGAAIEGAPAEDGGETVQLKKFTATFGLTDVAIKNDDTTAFNAVAEQAANAAATAEGDRFFAVLTSNAFAGPTLADGNPFFHSSRANIAAGAAPSTTSIGEMVKLLRAQRAPGGQRLNLAARYVLVGPDYEINAREVITAITSGAAPALEVLVDSALTTSWYLFTDPRVRPAFAHCYLEDLAEPDVQDRTRFQTDGLEWRVVTAFEMAPYDPRCAVRNPGA